MIAAKPNLVELQKRDIKVVEDQAKDIGKQKYEEQAPDREAAKDARRLEQLASLKQAQPSHFRILGWCGNRNIIYYQSAATGQIACIKNAAHFNALNPLAPIEFWRNEFPRLDKEGNPIPDTVSWEDACSHIGSEANAAGVFTPEAVRGRGVWLEHDGSIIWHLGDRLVVNGKTVDLIQHASRHHYHRLSPLHINPDGPLLTDQQGKTIAEAVHGMGWEHPVMAAYTLGWAVTSNVAAALEHRPALQVTAPFGSGKTDVFKAVLKPLSASTCLYEENSTEAGIRQTLGPDTIPVLIDESELEDPKKRDGHVRLARHSYNGTGSSRGTTHGKALHFNVRSSIALAGINTTLDKGQDQSRIVVVTKAFLPQEQWVKAKAKLGQAITPEIGEALIRRTVHHFHTLQKNIATLKAVIASQFPPDVSSGRFGDTYGTLLAAYHLLTSTAVLTDDQALAFLDRIGWASTLITDSDTDEQNTRDAGGMACLNHILAHELPWRLDEGTGRNSIRELIALARDQGATASVDKEVAAEAAANALARLGIRAKRSDPGLFIAVGAVLIKPILANTVWIKGDHTKQLRTIPKATADRKRINSNKGEPAASGTTVPWNLISADWS